MSSGDALSGAVPVADARAAGQARLHDYLVLIVLAIASRMVLALVAAGTEFGAQGDGRLNSSLVSLFIRWDAAWYQRIAAYGYAAMPIDYEVWIKPHAFFPLYPMLIRGLAAVTGIGLPLAAVLLSNLFFLLALFVIYEYVRALGLESKVAVATGLLLCCAPHTFVFAAGYAESLFLLLLAGAMLCMHRRRYLLAGTLAALLSATRPNGVLFIVFAVAWTLRDVGWRAFLAPWRTPGPFLVIVMAPLGLVAYWWFCFLTTGDAFAQKSAVTHGWGWSPDWPWANLARHLGAAALNRFWAVGALLYFAASLLLLPMRRYEEFAYCLASFLLVWSSVLSVSLIRYAVVLFPIFVAFAAVTVRRPLAFATLTAGLAALNAFLLVGYVLNWSIAV